MPDENVISDAIAFYEKIKAEDEVTVKFTKKDRTTRIMRCTLDFTKVPASKRPKDVNMAKIFKLVSQHGIIHVFDLDKQDWRSVPFQTSEWLETTGENATRFSIKH